MTTIPELLSQGRDHHQAGRLAQAETCYRHILTVAPQHADALVLLGAACLMQGKPGEAVVHLQSALQQAPQHGGALENLGIALASLGRLDEAAVHFAESVKLNPGYLPGRSNLAGVLDQLGRLDEAADQLRAAVKLDPKPAPLLVRLADVLIRQGKAIEAIGLLNQALHLESGHVEATRLLAQLPADVVCTVSAEAERFYQRGTTALAQGRLAEATSLLREAVLRNPALSGAHHNLGVAYSYQGQFAEAAGALEESLRLKPDQADVYNCLGMVRAQQRRLKDAVAAFRHSLHLNPASPEAHSNLGIALWDQNLLPEALESFREAVRLKPDMAAGHTNLSMALSARGETAEAVSASQTALRLSPTTGLRILDAFLLPIIYRSLAEVSDWRGRVSRRIQSLLTEGVRADITHELPPTLFYLAYQGRNDCDILKDAASLFQPPADPPLPEPLAHGSKKIRVGFISAFFKNHTIGDLMGGLADQMSRKDFEVTVISAGHHEDDMARFIRSHCDRYVELPQGLARARTLVRDLGLDVLVHTDVGMDRVTYALALSRLAPVQCATWGHPSTTGSPVMDYFLTSQLFESAAAPKHYTETLVHLRNLPFYGYASAPVADPRGRDYFGLPNDVHLYGCPQALFKFHPEFDSLLAGILRADPKGLLVLNRGRHPFSSHWEELLRQRFTVTMPDVAARVRFLPYLNPEDFQRLYQITDVLLDPPQFNGGNTSLKAFALGVPIVTLPGAFLKSRMTQAFYRKMGVKDGIASSPREYVRLAVRMGTEPDFRREVSQRILAAKGVLVNNADGVRDMEEFFHQAVECARMT